MNESRIVGIVILILKLPITLLLIVALTVMMLVEKIIKKIKP